MSSKWMHQLCMMSLETHVLGLENVMSHERNLLMFFKKIVDILPGRVVTLFANLFVRIQLLNQLRLGPGDNIKVRDRFRDSVKVRKRGLAKVRITKTGTLKVSTSIALAWWLLERPPVSLPIRIPGGVAMAEQCYHMMQNWQIRSKIRQNSKNNQKTVPAKYPLPLKYGYISIDSSLCKCNNFPLDRFTLEC